MVLAIPSLLILIQKYEWDGEVYNVDDTSTTESIILAGLLIYAKIRL